MGGKKLIARSREWQPVEGMREKTQLERDKEHKEREQARDFDKDETNSDAETKGTTGS